MTASVIIPMFNAAATIEAQLDALRGQLTRVQYEVVVVDNGSTDTSLKLVRAYETSWPKLRVVDGSAGAGSYYARNLGAAAAIGEVLLFCDADDIVGPRWVDAMCRCLQNADLAGGSVTPLISSAAGSLVTFGDELPTSGLVRLLEFLPFSITANLAIRASVFESLHGFDATYRNGGDAELCWRAQLAGFHLEFAEDALVAYRIRPDTISAIKQFYRYAVVHPLLFRNFRSQGMRRRGTSNVIRSWAGVVFRVPLLPTMAPRERRKWAINAATLAGRAVGSARARSVYL
jgi:GT2 family glycosyltransferase